MGTALVRRRVMRTVALITAAAALAACGSSAKITTAEPTTVAGSSASNLLTFTSPTVGGGHIDAASFIGKPVAFWFWAPG
jgi:ABC-type glycerol-3-phosphate transport system substrate-binding protein